ncbi:hypothetical protein QAD02_000888 [Eretmocerus hayati]|uniref:Uncharacterized protein n=1 Tax=Eretmocerus hayati TaxID=131215 RepID=A0ACC2NEX0_9HYME|nr:hypothetical protein QAD02_000888 [Eretmocerus hayati]
MNGKKHRGLTAGYLVASDESDNSPLDSDSYACFVCNLTFPTLQELLKHYSELDHKLKMGNFEKVHQHNLMDIYVSNGEPFIHCKLCNDQFPTLKAAVKHISRKKHVANFQLSHKDPIQISNGAELFLNALEVRKSDSKLERRSEIDVDVSDKSCKNLTISNLRSAKTPTSVTLRDLVQFDHKRFTEENSLMSENDGTNQESTVDASSDQKEIDARNAFLDDRNITSLKEKSTNCCIYSEIWNIYNIDSEVIRLLNVGVDLSIVGDSKRYCFLCQITFSVNLPSLLEHLQSQIHITNFYNMEKEDDRCNGKIFTSLKLAKLLIKKESEDILICCICDRNTQIHNNYSQIVEHYKSAEHMKKSIALRKQAKVVNRQLSSMFRDAWYYAETFACKICKQEYNSDIQFVKHLQDPEHMKHVHQHDAVKLKFHLCPYCTKLWYGSSETHSVPCEDDLDKHMISGDNASATFMREIDNLQGLFDSLNESMDSLIMESDEVQLVMIRGCEILSCLEETVKHSYPNARAYSFGSRVSLLGLTDSDMNIFLDCENQNYIVGCSKDKVQWYLANVCLELKNQTNIWTVFEILFKTREPMIKLLHEPSGVDCEILLLNGLKVEKSRLLGLYNAASPCCRRMILYLREWLKYLECFPGSDDIMTTAIAWCVIFYLQVQGILPPVLDLVKQSNASKIIDGWECGFNEIVPQILPDFNFTEHLHGFFLYFARFDYQKFVACPYLGLVIAKHDFAHTDQLPEEMDIYKFRASANVNDVFEFNSPMCIQDPIDMSHNMTGHVNKSDLRRFRQYCVNIAQIMAQKPDF